MSKTIRSYRDLLVWQKGMELIDEVDSIIEELDSFRKWSIGMQMYRAAVSIVLNIAEGHDHDYSGVYLRNLSDARGSTREVECAMLVIRRRKYLPDAKLLTAFKLLDEIGPMLRSLRQRIRVSAARSRPQP